MTALTVGSSVRGAIGRRNGRSARFCRILFAAACGMLMLPAAARADDPVLMWNNTLISVIQATSAALVDGPPEVAREMAIVDNAMYNAVNAATGGYDGNGSTTGVSGANASAAALAAGYGAMLALFSPAGTLDNPNVGNTTTIGNLWSTGTANGGLSATAAATIVAQIQTAYATALASLPPASTDPTVAAGLSVGAQQAASIVQQRIGSLTTNDDADGSYAAITSGLSKANYTPGSGAYSGLAPGASTATGVGVYVQPANRPALFPAWGTVTPFTMTTANLNALVATIPPPPDVTSAAYANALITTYCTGGTSSSPSFATTCANAAAAGVDVTIPTSVGGVSAVDNALFWNDPGSTFQPPGHWLDITDNVISDLSGTTVSLSLLDEARLSAMVSDAENDAGTAAWDAKYQYNLWRPITAITGNGTCQYGGSWNATLTSYGLTCDPNWKSVIATPPHPDYIAGHPAYSGAAATVLENFFGTDDPDGLTFTSTSEQYCNGGTATRAASDPVTGAVGEIISCTVGSTVYSTCYDPDTNPDSTLICPITETYNSFTDASQAATDSRVNGGIHTPFAVADALQLGDDVGGIVADDPVFAVPEPSWAVFAGMPMLALLRRRRR